MCHQIYLIVLHLSSFVLAWCFVFSTGVRCEETVEIEIATSIFNSTLVQSSSKSNNSPVLMYALDALTLDNLFSNYIQTELYRRKQQSELHKEFSANKLGHGAISLNGQNPQMIIKGNLIQYIYNIHNSNCNHSDSIVPTLNLTKDGATSSVVSTTDNDGLSSESSPFSPSTTNAVSNPTTSDVIQKDDTSKLPTVPNLQSNASSSLLLSNSTTKPATTSTNPMPIYTTLPSQPNTTQTSSIGNNPNVDHLSPIILTKLIGSDIVTSNYSHLEHNSVNASVNLMETIINLPTTEHLNSTPKPTAITESFTQQHAHSQSGTFDSNSQIQSTNLEIGFTKQPTISNSIDHDYFATIRFDNLATTTESTNYFDLITNSSLITSTISNDSLKEQTNSILIGLTKSKFINGDYLTDYPTTQSTLTSVNTDTMVNSTTFEPEFLNTLSSYHTEMKLQPVNSPFTDAQMSKSDTTQTLTSNALSDNSIASEIFIGGDFVTNSPIPTRNNLSNLNIQSNTNSVSVDSNTNLKYSSTTLTDFPTASITNLPVSTLTESNSFSSLHSNSLSSIDSLNNTLITGVNLPEFSSTVSLTNLTPVSSEYSVTNFPDTIITYNSTPKPTAITKSIIDDDSTKPLTILPVVSSLTTKFSNENLDSLNTSVDYTTAPTLPESPSTVSFVNISQFDSNYPISTTNNSSSITSVTKNLNADLSSSTEHPTNIGGYFKNTTQFDNSASTEFSDLNLNEFVSDYPTTISSLIIEQINSDSVSIGSTEFNPLIRDFASNHSLDSSGLTKIYILPKTTSTRPPSVNPEFFTDFQLINSTAISSNNLSLSQQTTSDYTSTGFNKHTTLSDQIFSKLPDDSASIPLADPIFTPANFSDLNTLTVGSAIDNVTRPYLDLDYSTIFANTSTTLNYNPTSISIPTITKLSNSNQTKHKQTTHIPLLNSTTFPVTDFNSTHLISNNNTSIGSTGHSTRAEYPSMALPITVTESNNGDYTQNSSGSFTTISYPTSLKSILYSSTTNLTFPNRTRTTAGYLTTLCKHVNQTRTNLKNLSFNNSASQFTKTLSIKNTTKITSTSIKQTNKSPIRSTFNLPAMIEEPSELNEIGGSTSSSPKPLKGSKTTYHSKLSSLRVTRYPSPITVWNRIRATQRFTFSLPGTQNQTRTRPGGYRLPSTVSHLFPLRHSTALATNERSAATTPTVTTKRISFVLGNPDYLLQLNKRFQENKRHILNRLFSSQPTTTRRPVLFPSFSKWIQANLGNGR